MRMSAYVLAAALTAAAPRVVMAQSAAAVPAAVPAAAPATEFGTTASHWIVSGFVGSNFGKSTSDPSVDFGGQIAYLWRGVLGAEALADFAPSFAINNNTGLSESPRSNSYMGNAVLALPIGGEGQFQPYFSGGVGVMQLVTKVFNAALPHLSGSIPTGTSQGSDFKLGTNLGGGVMAYRGLIGFRADVRYYKASNDTTVTSTTAAGQFTEGLLTSLNYWRANIGVAVRW